MSIIYDKKSQTHRLQYTDWTGKRRTLTCPKGTTPKAARDLFSKIKIEQAEIKRGIRPPPSAGATKPFDDALKEYLAWGNAKGGKGGRPWSKKHARERPRFLKFWKEKLNLSVVADLVGSLPDVERVLGELKICGVGINGKQFRPLTGKTLNAYINAICAFCRWCDERDYLDKFPLKGLEKFHAAPITHRRSLTPDEIRKLLDAVDPPHAIAYELAIFTGLRAGELLALLCEDFDPASECINLHPRWTKNRKGGFQPIPPSLVEHLKKEVEGRGAKEPLIKWRFGSHSARCLDRDLKLAKIPKKTDAGKLDFHALRVAYATLIGSADIRDADAMALMRHGSMTMVNKYRKPVDSRMVAIVRQIGEMIPPPSSEKL